MWTKGYQSIRDRRQDRAPSTVRTGRLVEIKFLFVLLLLPPLFGRSQSALPVFGFQYDQSVIITADGKTLANPWAGGINAGQFSKIHLDRDRIEDLFIFDRTNNKISTFVATSGSEGYYFRYAPEYESFFPDLNGWALLADYNGDGRKDLFTHSNLGIAVYRNVSNTGALLWEMAAAPVFTQGFSGQVNLQVSVSDIPSIVDVDNDGDLDIIAFDFNGSFVQYHQNLSMETYGRPDALLYKRMGQCWGNFEYAHCGRFTFGIDCGGGGRQAFPGEGLRVQHSGTAILTLDLNGDLRKDILISDVACDDLFRLNNEGSNQKPVFNNFQKDFPAEKPVSFPIFPAVFSEDLDFDGKKDLIASPNVFTNEGNQINFRESAWLYHNSGTENSPAFEFRQPDFLQRGMVDLGEDATPAFADIDGDGDLDLLVGHRGQPDNFGLRASICLFENTGTATQPAFVRQTSDYLQVSQFRVSNLKPLFADFNRDGSLDMGFTAQQGLSTRFWYIPNQSARNQPARYILQDTVALSLPLALNDTPFPYDLDRDGDLDWLVGKAQGNLEYYQNTGTSSQPVFILNNPQVGQIVPEPAHGNLSPIIADFNADGKPDLLCGDPSGRLRLYNGFVQDLASAREPAINLVLDSLQGQWNSPKLGSAIFPAAADLNGDHLPELVIGTNAGGMRYLQNISHSGDFNPEPIIALAYPNPVNKYLYIRVPYDCEAVCFNMLGQVVNPQKYVLANQETSVSVSHLANGIYVLRLTSHTGETRSIRVIVNKN